MSEAIQKLFDSIAPRYDLLNSLLSWNIDAGWRRKAVQALQGDRYQNVLDFCAGTLSLTLALFKVNSSPRVTAVDFSKPMLTKGLERIPSSLKSRVTSVVSDVLTMNLSPQSFDAAMCAYGVRNVDDNPALLKKVRSLLKPGGKLVILEFFKPENFFEKLFHFTYAEFIIPIIGRLISKHPQAYQHLRDSIRNFYTVTDYKKILESAGFHRIVATPLTGGISYLITAEAV